MVGNRDERCRIQAGCYRLRKPLMTRQLVLELDPHPCGTAPQSCVRARSFVAPRILLGSATPSRAAPSTWTGATAIAVVTAGASLCSGLLSLRPQTHRRTRQNASDPVVGLATKMLL
jgi:hypothetical protein